MDSGNDKAKKRAGYLELESRVNQVKGWIIRGVPTALIVEQCVKKEWGGVKNAYALIKKGRALIKTEDTGDEDDKKAAHVQMLMALAYGMDQRLATTPAGISAKNNVYKQIAEINGYTKPQGGDDDGANGSNQEPHALDYGKLSEEELLTLIKLHEKAKQGTA